jgi:2-hydroxychromene-2-carboxylate isomerase
MSNAITGQITKIITSRRLLNLRRNKAEKQRQKRSQPHRVTVYLRINDAYSYLLLQVLAPLAKRFPLEYEFRTVLELQSDMYPAPALWDNNAFIDGQYLAPRYQLRFPEQKPSHSAEQDRAFTAQLLHWELQPGYLDNALALFDAYWHNNDTQAEALIDQRIVDHHECYQQHRQANETLLQTNGHYLSGMLHYGGEWYWGLDRLEHLEQRLNDLGLAGAEGKRIDYNLSHRDFCQSPAAKQASSIPLVIYWSARSPYSYLGLVRARQLAKHYQVPLEIKPVLPMVMRRMQVPKTKRFYILLDVKREAEKVDLDFGIIADPLGRGVERCYALFELATEKGLAAEFCESFARGVWAEGIRSDTDAGLKQLVERAGINWAEAKPLLNDQSWRAWAQSNLVDMYGEGLWGVPSFTYGDLRLFGQDRLDCIEREIIKKGAEAPKDE